MNEENGIKNPSLDSNKWLDSLKSVLNKKLNLETREVLDIFYSAKGTNDIILTPFHTCNYAPTQYTVGMGVTFIAEGVNTSEVRVKVNGLGYVSVKSPLGDTLKSGIFKEGHAVKLLYNGSYFQVVAIASEKTGTIQVYQPNHLFRFNAVHWNGEYYEIADLKKGKLPVAIAEEIDDDTFTLLFDDFFSVDYKKHKDYKEEELFPGRYYLDYEVPGALTRIKPKSGYVVDLLEVVDTNSGYMGRVAVDRNPIFIDTSVVHSDIQKSFVASGADDYKIKVKGVTAFGQIQNKVIYVRFRKTNSRVDPTLEINGFGKIKCLRENGGKIPENFIKENEIMEVYLTGNTFRIREIKASEEDYVNVLNRVNEMEEKVGTQLLKLSADTTPSLSGNLDANDFAIFSQDKLELITSENGTGVELNANGGDVVIGKAGRSTVTINGVVYPKEAGVEGQLVQMISDTELGYADYPTKETIGLGEVLNYPFSNEYLSSAEAFFGRTGAFNMYQELMDEIDGVKTLANSSLSPRGGFDASTGELPIPVKGDEYWIVTSPGEVVINGETFQLTTNDWIIRYAFEEKWEVMDFNNPKTTWENIQNKPTEFTPALHTHLKSEIGLGNLQNWGYSTSAADGSTEKYVRADVAKWLNDNKLDKSEKSADSVLLDGLDSSQFLRSDTSSVLNGTLTIKTKDVPLVFEQSEGVGSRYRVVNDSQTGFFRIDSDLSEDGTFGTYRGITLNEEGILSLNTSSEDGLFINGYKVLHAGNGGAESGFDADKLDGAHAEESPTFGTIPKRDSEGNISVNESLKFSTGDSLGYEKDTENLYHTSNGEPKKYFVFSQKNKPTKEDVGLDKVNNWGASSSVTEPSTTIYATTAGTKAAYDKAAQAFELASSKLSSTGSAANSNSLEGRNLTETGEAGSIPYITEEGVFTVSKYFDLKNSMDGTGEYSSRIEVTPETTLKITNGYGNLEIGAKDETTLQLNTSMPTFNLNKDVYVNNKKVFSEGYHPKSDKLTTPRNISVSGGATGNVSFDGSSDVDINLTIKDDSHKHSTYTHSQVSPSNEWSINHKLGKMPSVTIVDSGGSVVVGDIEYVDADNLRLSFSSAFSGKVFLN